MIPLLHVPKPRILTEKYVREKTAHYKDTKKKVWGSKNLIRALLEMGRNKCAYCECNVSEESKYMEVEHFKPKALYPDDVLNWDNLLPSCKRCNGQKDNHDVLSHPIVNPRFDLPKAHLKFKGAFLYGKTTIGEMTTGQLELNDPVRLALVRAQIAELIDSQLYEWQERLGDIRPLHPSEWPRLQRRIGVLLEEAGPWKDYAAFTATYLLRHSAYSELRAALEQAHAWTSELNAAEQTARDIALFP
jgi:5-methylcytosine-specific restriction endonuclease McrA